MKNAFHEHSEEVLARELARVRELPPGRRRRVERACADVAAAVVDGILDEARSEPRLAAALASIYGPEPPARTTLSPWPAEAARRG
ncbi:MAG: hypothetical protein E6G26_12085 [Actinobacteria bacterium]|nr:MAG: hypothetical protein E6G26_12085 [Actinomycetota bacterium]